MSEDQDQPITHEQLAVFDPDPVVAAAKYQKLRTDLIRALQLGGCHDPEGVVSEAIDRGLKRIEAGVDTTKGGPRGYIWGVARLVALERRKIERREQQLDPDAWSRRSSGDREREQVEAKLMLSQVRRLLSEDERRLLLRYAAERDHTAHCAELGVKPSYLRVLAFRIRNKLKAKALPADAPRVRSARGSRSKT